MSTSLSPRSSASVHPTRQQLDELDALLQRMLELPVNGVPEQPVARNPAPAPAAENARTVRHDPPESAPGADTDGGDDREAWVPLRSSWQPSAQTWGPLAKQWQEAQQAGETLPPTARTKNIPEAPPAKTADDDRRRLEVVSASKILALSMGQKATSVRELGPLQSAVEEEEPKKAAPTAWRVDAAAHEALEPLPSLKALLPPLTPVFPAEKKAEPAAPVRTEAPLAAWQWPFAAIDSVFDGCLVLLGPLGLPLRSRGGKSFLGVIGLLCLTGAAVVTALDWFGWNW